MLERTLNSLSQMIDRSIADVQAAARSPARARAGRELMEELQVAATIEAAAGGYILEVSSAGPGLELDTDRLMVAAAITNLLRNAFKFSSPGSPIAMRAREVFGPEGESSRCATYPGRAASRWSCRWRRRAGPRNMRLLQLEALYVRYACSPSTHSGFGRGIAVEVNSVE